MNGPSPIQLSLVQNRLDETLDIPPLPEAARRIIAVASRDLETGHAQTVWERKHAARL